MTVTTIQTALSVVFLMVWAFIAQIVISRKPDTLRAAPAYGACGSRQNDTFPRTNSEFESPGPPHTEPNPRSQQNRGQRLEQLSNRLRPVDQRGEIAGKISN